MTRHLGRTSKFGVQKPPFTHTLSSSGTMGMHALGVQHMLLGSTSCLRSLLMLAAVVFAVLMSWSAPPTGEALNFLTMDCSWYFCRHTIQMASQLGNTV